MNDLLTALWETAKEPLRYLVLAIIPVLITYFTKSEAVWAAIAVIVLRLLDKLIYEYGKAIEDDDVAKGLTRF